MGINKVEYFGDTLIDVSGDTVTPDTLLNGVTAHDNTGEQIMGTLSINAGTIKTVSLSGTKSLTTSWTNLVSMTLTPGVWIITGRVRSDGSSNGTRGCACNISGTRANDWVAASTYAPNGYYIGLETTNILKITSNTEIYLNARSYGGTLSLGTMTTMKAVQIC